MMAVCSEGRLSLNEEVLVRSSRTEASISQPFVICQAGGVLVVHKESDILAARLCFNCCMARVLGSPRGLRRHECGD
jgi:hypothetical protein